MKHARKDYDRIQDPALNDPSLLGEGSTPIGKGEPVVLFRAQDELFISVLIFYRSQVIKRSVSKHNGKITNEAKAIVKTINEHIDYAQGWQRQYGCKEPDLPKNYEA